MMRAWLWPVWCVALAATAAHADDIFSVAPELWDRPRGARMVREQTAVAQAVRLALSRPAARLVIHHGFGQEPLLYAEELRAWLMALAVDGARISLVSDTKVNEALRIEVTP